MPMMKWLNCSAIKPKIWYLRLEVNQHELAKRFLKFRFVIYAEISNMYATYVGFVLCVYAFIFFFFRKQTNNVYATLEE